MSSISTANWLRYRSSRHTASYSFWRRVPAMRLSASSREPPCGAGRYVSARSYKSNLSLTERPNCPQILKFQSHSDRPDPFKHPKLPVHRRHVVLGHRSSAVPVLAELMLGPQSIDTTGLSPMKQVGFHSVISGMNLLIAADATIIACRDRLPRDPFGGLEMGIGRATEPRKDSIVASEGALVLHVPLALLIPEIGVTAASARDPVVSMKAKQIYLCLGEPSETYQRCRSWCWRNLTGGFNTSRSLLDKVTNVAKKLRSSCRERFPQPWVASRCPSAWPTDPSWRCRASSVY